MLRIVLLLILVAFIARAFWRVIDGVLDGMRGERAVTAKGRPASTAVQMARDPVCGTFVVPDRAVPLTESTSTLYFCSTRCRDVYRNGEPAARSGAHGRTA